MCLIFLNRELNVVFLIVIVVIKSGSLYGVSFFLLNSR